MLNGDPHGDRPVLHEGHDLASARSAFILLHGRGGSADDILSVGVHLADRGVALIAPQAADYSWYPNSFLAPLAQNQPWLKSAIRKVASCIDECIRADIPTERIAVMGFSQGACLATEFVATNPAKYGALIAFTGGLLGPLGSSLEYQGTLEGAPCLLSSGDPDPHVPWSRVEETGRILTSMGAAVQVVRHPNRPHTILDSELVAARDLLVAAAFFES